VASDEAETIFSTTLVQDYGSWLLEPKLLPSTLRLSPLRRLAREMAENGSADTAIASAIERTKGVKPQGLRAGNCLLKGQAK
jgi:hypothetical protein